MMKLWVHYKIYSDNLRVLQKPMPYVFCRMRLVFGHSGFQNIVTKADVHTRRSIALSEPAQGLAKNNKVLSNFEDLDKIETIDENRRSNSGAVQRDKKNPKFQFSTAKYSRNNFEKSNDLLCGSSQREHEADMELLKVEKASSMSRIKLLRDQIREDLVQLAEQLYTNITEELTKHEPAAEVTNIDKINIINGKVVLTENVHMPVEIYMKAAQASNMRKRANIAMTGIWEPDDIMRFVAKRCAGRDDLRVITEEEILILHLAVTKMQEHKCLSTDKDMDLTNLRTWMAYKSKMARSNTRADDSEEGSEDNEQIKPHDNAEIVEEDKEKQDSEEEEEKQDSEEEEEKQDSEEEKEKQDSEEEEYERVVIDDDNDDLNALVQDQFDPLATDFDY